MERLNARGRILIKDQAVNPRWTNEMVRLYGESFCACEPYWEFDAAGAIIPEMGSIENDPNLFILTLPDGDRLTGFLVATSVDPERFSGLLDPDKLQQKEKDDLYILELAVDKRYRGQGLGSMLVSETINEAQKAGKGGVTLRADLRNTPAIRLYQNLGFNLLTENTGVSPFDVYIRKDLKSSGADSVEFIGTDCVQSLFERFPLEQFIFFTNAGEIEGWRRATGSKKAVLALAYNAGEWSEIIPFNIDNPWKKIWRIPR